MKICVIGGTGNISRRIVDELINNNHDVYCFNRGLSGDVPNGAQHIIGDRNDYKFFEKRIQDESFDYAIDMVCMDSKQALSSIRAFNGVKHLITCGIDPEGGYHPMFEHKYLGERAKQKSVWTPEMAKETEKK